MEKKRIRYKSLRMLGLLLLSAFLMAAFADRQSHWYASLVVSPFQPEDRVITIGFFVGYLIIGLSLIRMLRRGMGEKGEYAGLCHLAALPCVSYLFFAVCNPAAAVIALCLCLATAILTALWGARYSPFAAWLWTAQILWLCAMLVFCYSIVMLN